MLLDLLDYPSYTLTLPSSGKILSYRPFLEMERKVLLMALQAADEKEIRETIKNIIGSCFSLKPTEINETLTLFDIEYMFLHLRAKSIEEIVSLNYTCDNILENDSPCGNIMKVDVNLLDIPVEGLDKNSLIVPLNKDLFVEMRYPTLDNLRLDVDEETDDVTNLIIDCIHMIYSSKETHLKKDLSREDLVTFLGRLTIQQSQKLVDFVENLPTVKKVLTIVCDKCKYSHTITLQGLQSFFL